MNKLLEQIKLDALKNNVPIIQDDGLAILMDYINKYNVNKMIEIGTAVGYSALCFSEALSIERIDTFERNEDMFRKAQHNIELAGKQDVIIQHFGDALECDISNLLDQYDLLFIDAAKAQSQKFFERFLPFVKQDGLIIVDNMLFHGIKKTDPGISRNVRQLVTKIERFTNWLKSNDQFDVTFYDGGDGLAIIKRK